MTLAFVALGANLGDPAATVISALATLRDLPSSVLVRSSSLYRTAPVGLRHQPDFINAVAAIDTLLTPDELLAALFAIEGRFGRTRSVPNAPRTLDLDLLLHGDTVIQREELCLPHPRMHLRAFVLAPLLEIAPDIALPGLAPATALLAACDDQRIERLGP